MVRFGRLSSWRSWDLLQVDSEIPESLPVDNRPTSNDCQVRERFMDLTVCITVTINVKGLL